MSEHMAPTLALVIIVYNLLVKQQITVGNWGLILSNKVQQIYKILHFQTKLTMTGILAAELHSRPSFIRQTD